MNTAPLLLALVTVTAALPTRLPEVAQRNLIAQRFGDHKAVGRTQNNPINGRMRTNAAPVTCSCESSCTFYGDCCCTCCKYFHPNAVVQLIYVSYLAQIPTPAGVTLRALILVIAASTAHMALPAALAKDVSAYFALPCLQVVFTAISPIYHIQPVSSESEMAFGLRYTELLYLYRPMI